MPIPLLGEIERLINERGSAAIMKERLALANDQYIALERKLSDALSDSKESQLREQAAELRASNLETEKLRLELDVQKLKEEVASLKHAEPLVLKFGIYWSADGTPHCNRCKTPITRLGWASHFNGQVKAMFCECAKVPIVLMEAGAPVDASIAMQRMANGAP